MLRTDTSIHGVVPEDIVQKTYHGDRFAVVRINEAITIFGRVGQADGLEALGLALLKSAKDLRTMTKEEKPQCLDH